MFVPFISRRSRKVRAAARRLGDDGDDFESETGIGEIRAGIGGGGGGGGRSGGSSSGGSGSGGSSSGGSKSGGSNGKSGGTGSTGSGGSNGKSGGTGTGSGGKGGSSGPSISTGSGGGPRPATVSGKGGGPVIVIPKGQPFSGRPAGGGTRGQIYGTSQYGSGYPGIAGRGTFGRGFPFYFWPVVWGGHTFGAGASYLDPSDYGLPTNTSRPGGPLATAAFPSSSSNTTFRLLSDNQTVVALIGTITNGCSSDLQNASAITATPYDNSSSLPKPEQAIQYYRSSSIVLALDGYNNTGDLAANSSASDVPLPSNIDHKLLDCMNTTIGATAPLVNASNMMRTTPISGLLGLAYIIWILLDLS